MEALFIKILNMSIGASYLVLAVFIFRLLFKKAPKWLNVILWAMVGFRLLCPFSIESVLSLVPTPAETVPVEIVDTVESVLVGSGTLDPVITDDLSSPDEVVSISPVDVAMHIIVIVWLAGIGAMVLYSLISYLKIHKRVREAIPLKHNIFVCDRIDTPFIFGVIRPKIYIPSNMKEKDAEYVIAHEKAHLKRLDHIWKPLGFLLLGVYWFNPIIWVAYVLLCRDIELACDEKVIKEMGTDIKREYSDALINCSVPRKMITACPLAFGEVGIKQRIKSVLNYKKPAFWIIILAVIASIVVGVCFLTNPKTENLEATNPELDKAISQAILDINSEGHWLGECAAEGHIVYGVEASGNKYKVYITEDYTTFGFTNGFFMSQSGHRVPAVMTFEKVNDTYKLVDKEYAQDGERYPVSIKKMFPREYRNRVLSPTTKDTQSMWEQCVAYAEAYLEKIGREATICTYGDIEHILFTDVGISVEVSNKLCGLALPYNTEIGNYEAIEDGIRYVYRTSYLEDKNVILYTKEVYGTDEVVERIEIDSLTGNIISTNSSAYIFDAKVLEVTDGSVLVEPIKDEFPDKIWVSTKVTSSIPIPDLYEGLYIRIMYDGLIQETYPAQISKVSAIYLYADTQQSGSLATKEEESTTQSYVITEATEKTFPIPQKTLFYSKGTSVSCSSADTQKIASEVGLYIQNENPLLLKLAVTEDMINKIKKDNNCVELQYSATKTIYLDEMAGGAKTYSFEKLLIPLDGDYKGVIFFEKNGEYQHGPIKSTQQKNIDAIMKLVQKKEPIQVSLTPRKSAFNLKNIMDDNKIICYDLDRNEYYRFIENPSEAFLNNYADDAVSYSRSDNDKKFVCKNISTGKSGEVTEGISRLGVHPPICVYATLIDDLDNSDNLKEYLKKKSFSATPKASALIYSSGYPIIAWVKAGNSSCFLRIDDVITQWEDGPEGVYTYSYFSQKAFCDKYTPKNAKLIVNGKDITNGNYVKLHHDYADLPLIEVLESLGAKVNWKDKRNAEIVYGGKKYKLDIDTGKLTTEDNVNRIAAMPTGPRFCIKADNIFILDSVHTKYLLRTLNSKATLDIDYDKRVVTIKTR